MGFEFRITVQPMIPSLKEFCNSLFARSEWKQIPTSLVDVSDGIGIQFGERPENPAWPHDADLCRDGDCAFYAVAYGSNGIRFLAELAKEISTSGYTVDLDGDYY